MLSVKRSKKNPILSPDLTHAWESLGSFNPSPLRVEDTTHIYYRALGEPDALRTPGRGFSTIGYTYKKDSEEFKERMQCIVPTEPYEEYGCEDPRVTFFEGKYYVFYTALGGFPFSAENIKVAVAIGSSPTELSEKHLVTPFNAKAATLFPKRINGEAVLLLTVHTDWTEQNPRPIIALARSKNIEDFWNLDFWNTWHKNIAEHVLPDVRRNDTEHMEVASTPLYTKDGWLLIYSHIQNYYDETRRIFGIEALLLEHDNPQKILGKTEHPFIVPEEYYERYGLVSNITFPSGVLKYGDTLEVYYGGADTVSAVAYLSYTDLLESMDTEKRNTFMKRHSDTPLIAPIPEHPWESVCVFNTAAIDLLGSVHLLYRAMGADNTSVLGYARLADGVTVDERLPEPVYVPREEYEQKKGTPTGNSGCEDPRISSMNETLYLCYTAYDGVHNTRGALSTISKDDFVSKNFNWSTPSLLTPEHINNKDICIFDTSINGKIVIMHRIDPVMCLDEFDTLPSSRQIDKCIELMGSRKGMWDSLKVGAGAPPIKIPEGWLVIYHGVGDDHMYRLGAALLDETGKTIISRLAFPILSPVLSWEKEGVIPNVVFTCGVVLREDTLFVYYGGADTAIGVATLSKSKLIKKLLPNLTIV
jgi:beta-1,2-mannobiose phosphorylase / 1,2-beta-oligomannan phosphorylase